MVDASASLLLLDTGDGEGTLRVSAAVGPLAEQKWVGLQTNSALSLAGWIIREHQGVYRVDNPEQAMHRNGFVHPRIDSAPVRSMMCVPLWGKDGPLGGIVFVDGQQERFGQHEAYVLKDLSGQFALAIERASLYRRQVSKAERDGLTGLYNRRSFDEALRREIDRAKRYNSTIAVMLVDIDHFKGVNDTYGHQAGDAVLQEVGALLQQQVRESDTPARFGGEEFAVLLPEAKLSIAVKLAERLRKHIKAMKFETDEGERFQVTASFGVALLGLDGDTGDAVIRAADMALYASKEGGRNRVTAASKIAATV